MLKKLFGLMLIGIGVLFLIGNIVSLDVVGKWWSGPTASIHEQKSLSADQVKRIQVDSDIASIQVSPSQDQQIYVKLTGQIDEDRKSDVVFDVEEKGDLVQVELKMHPQGDFFSFRDFGFNKVELNLSLPKQLYDEITVQTDIGKIDILQLQANQLHVETNVGKVAVQQFQGQKASINSDVGLIQVSESKGAFDISTHTGKVEFKTNAIEDDLFIESDTGKVEVISNTPPENLNLRVRSDVGSINADVPGLSVEEKSEYTLSGRIGNGEPNVDIRTDVGKIDFIVR